MSKTIFATNNGLITEGIVAAREPIWITRIVMDNPMDILGFRKSVKQYDFKTQDDRLVQDIEVGYFFEMLYEGRYEAFKLLKMPEEHHLVSNIYDFDMIREKEEHLVSLGLVRNLLDESKKMFNNLEDPSIISREEENNQFVVEKLAYNNRSSYICLRNVMLAESILNKYTFDMTIIDKQALQAIRDGALSLKAITEGYESYVEKIEKLLESTDIPVRPDPEYLNELLLNVRNVELKPKQ